MPNRSSVSSSSHASTSKRPRPNADPQDSGRLLHSQDTSQQPSNGASTADAQSDAVVTLDELCLATDDGNQSTQQTTQIEPHRPTSPARLQLASKNPKATLSAVQKKLHETVISDADVDIVLNDLSGLAG